MRSQRATLALALGKAGKLETYASITNVMLSGEVLRAHDRGSIQYQRSPREPQLSLMIHG